MGLIATITITAEIVSFLVLLSIFMGYQINFSEKKNKPQKCFIALLGITMLALLADMSSYFIDVVFPNTFIQVLFVVLAFVMGDVVLFAYVIYYKASLKEIYPKNRFRFFPVHIMITLDIILDIVTIFTEVTVTTTKEGTVFNSLVIFTGVLPVCVFIYLCVITFKARKQMPVNRCVAFYVYIAILVLSLIAMDIDSSWQFSLVATALAECVIFIIITSKQVSDACQREKYFKTMNYIDALTGLNNRLAYNEAIENAKTHIFVGIIYTDINGLKYANDHIGHHAGDKLIQRYTQILTSTFQKEVVYRVGGDEFVIIIPDIELTKLKNLVTELHKKIMQNNWIASVGYTSGKGVDVEELIMKAEKSMYAEKSNYHKAHSGNYARA